MSSPSYILLMDFELMSDDTCKVKHQKIWIDFQTEENFMTFEGDSYDTLPDYLESELSVDYSIEDIECERNLKENEDVSKLKIIKVPIITPDESEDDSESEKEDETTDDEGYYI
jgi:hypothetical protein